MQNFGCITVALAHRIACAEIAWPGPAGSIGDEILAAFDRLVQWLEGGDPCDAIILTLRRGLDDEGRSRTPSIEQCREWETLLLRIARLPCLSVAGVDGSCVRFWMQLVLACDHRIATARSTFQALELKEGYLPGMNVFRLARCVGISSARRFVFTGEPLDANSAAALGLVDHVCGSDQLEFACRRFLARFEPIHPTAMQYARRLLNESFSTAFEQFIDQYLVSQDKCLPNAMPLTESDPQ